MKITKLKNKEAFLFYIQNDLIKLGIILYDISFPTKTSIKFRAKRKFNKLYSGGGVKFGNYKNYGNIKKAAYLHWEEWAFVNEFINKICDNYSCGGSLKSWVDGQETWIRKNGQICWNNPCGKDDYLDLIDKYKEYQNETTN
ncbi:hypothetical protein KAR91_24665 [Candidatus Pacearchaeota archaeon]|nr:hypothetical protein [Candidatus Pacearchaeota archaeon]